MSETPRQKPFVIALGGPGSNTGKTRFLAALIGRLAMTRPVGALKIATATPDHLCARTGLACGCLQFDGKMRLLTDPAYIEKDGKDTGALHSAGARPVWWLQTTSDFQIEATREVLSRLEGPAIWVVEGAGPIRAGLADLNLLMARRDGRESKASYFELLPSADALVISSRDALRNSAEVLTELRGQGLRLETPVFDLEAALLPPALLAFIEQRLVAGRPRGLIRP